MPTLFHGVCYELEEWVEWVQSLCTIILVKAFSFNIFAVNNPLPRMVLIMKKHLLYLTISNSSSFRLWEE